MASRSSIDARRSASRWRGLVTSAVLLGDYQQAMILPQPGLESATPAPDLRGNGRNGSNLRMGREQDYSADGAGGQSALFDTTTVGFSWDRSSDFLVLRRQRLGAIKR